MLFFFANFVKWFHTILIRLCFVQRFELEFLKFLKEFTINKTWDLNAFLHSSLVIFAEGKHMTCSKKE